MKRNRTQLFDANVNNKAEPIRDYFRGLVVFSRWTDRIIIIMITVIPYQCVPAI